MAREHYPGERRGLSLFLEDLRPAVTRVCGPDSLLLHAIRRALRNGDLDHFRMRAPSSTTCRASSAICCPRPA